MGNWILYEGGSSIGKIGSENGKIIFDEEYEDSCRITLEKTKPIPYSITCGVYGLMCHTVFAKTEQEAKEKYEFMKIELKDFVDSYIEETDAVNWVECFVEKW